MKAQEFFTLKFFKENPIEVWRWHYNFKRMIFQSEPNSTHFSLANIQSFCKEANINFTLITQVIIIRCLIGF